MYKLPIIELPIIIFTHNFHYKITGKQSGKDIQYNQKGADISCAVSVFYKK